MESRSAAELQLLMTAPTRHYILHSYCNSTVSYSSCKQDLATSEFTVLNAQNSRQISNQFFIVNHEPSCTIVLKNDATKIKGHVVTSIKYKEMF